MARNHKWLIMNETQCNSENVERAADILVNAHHAIAFTGAGISTESGIPDFRGPQGLWRQYNPEIATIDYFLQHPKEFWLFYRMRLSTLFTAKPNRAHIALAELEKMGIIKTIITQNIDGLHQAAGSNNVIELHGTMRRAVCLACGHTYPMDAVIKKIDSGQVPPLCDGCGGILKPDTVLFGESVKDFERARELALMSDAVLVVGSSLSVYPAAYIPLFVKEMGGKVIIVNMEPTELDYIADVIIQCKAGDAMSLLLDAVKKKLSMK
ncbi:NAD-dependent deacetylase [Vulcanisaeta souniana JCM 11219]|uniref:NAD-dependent protein deacetylase n=2 Tax=Vulcanisaeta souniana TaxID=164452 RepID=A0A830EGL6_9CREN|nr:NAD-dependent deacetylase [Vulcanisaeta souniana JCM 11219]GGI69235.1 NAD-dependent deacetylase [Vulcanisaeta souniana JCM 11219]